MIGYMPSIYKDELVYSWFARYYVHSGHPAYVFALEDLLENRNMRVDMEFAGRLNMDAGAVIQNIIPMERLILEHTMFPYYRFIESARLQHALKAMSDSSEVAHRLLPVYKSGAGGQIPHIRYCPLCAVEAREVYGEAYWTRLANIRNVDICTRHRCRLKDTGIEISGKKSPRLYVADDEIRDTNPDIVEDGLELEFVRYLTGVFQKPVDMDNLVDIGEFLNSKLEGTSYLSARGKRRNINLLFNDFIEFFRELPNQGLANSSQLQKIFTGYRWDFYEICQLAYFLNISAEELVNPELPTKSQTELFNEKVAKLYDSGLGCHRIAKELGCCPSTARKANQVKLKKEYDHSGRKGIKKSDWNQMDNEMIQQVRDACDRIYCNYGGRPGHVTVYAVCSLLGLPDKRFEYLPKCREVIHGYEEKKEVYWAREVAWCYMNLTGSKEEPDIHWRDIRDITNLRRDNFVASFPYLNLFVDTETENKIRNLLPQE